MRMRQSTRWLYRRAAYAAAVVTETVRIGVLILGLLVVLYVFGAAMFR